MPPQCPHCGKTVFNKRYPKCEFCGADLPSSLVLTAEERNRLMRQEQDIADAAWLAARRAQANAITPAAPATYVYLASGASSPVCGDGNSGSCNTGS